MPRQGLTLIELLVVVAILTTLVAGVIPVLSPNNDARKIRETTRGLRTLLMSAQAEAARIGRPHGIGFTESTPGSGVAIEAFHVEVPPAFAGFSPDSRVTVDPVPDAPFLYGPTADVAGGNDRDRFSPTENGSALVRVRFVTQALNPDPLPPRTFRVGDVIEVRGNRYLIVDDARNQEFFFGGGTGYLDPSAHANPYDNAVVCVWLNNNGQVFLSANPTTGTLQPHRYTISRQPENAADPPFQLVSGVAIDLQASGVEGGTGTVDPAVDIADSFHSSIENANGIPNTVMILFQPEGNVESVYFNGRPVDGVSQIMLCVGRVELGGIQNVLTDGATQYQLSTAGTADELRQVQSQVNWLAPDSRWVAILPRLGSYRTVENNFVDAAKVRATSVAFGVQNVDSDSAFQQIITAREFARDGASSAGSGG
ncbi:MAG: prepilin-type N-terminal cleavage/methylation domain-containing protein [Planctomycetota bacterium]